MLLQVLFAGRYQLDGGELEAALLEARDDWSDQAALDTVGLDGDEAVAGWVSVVLLVDVVPFIRGDGGRTFAPRKTWLLVVVVL